MRKRKIITGKNIKEVYDWVNARSYQKGSKAPRQPRRNVTPKEVRRNNARIAEANLRMKIDMNFKEDDYYLTLTYEEAPEGEAAKRDIKQFIRELRKEYKKANPEAALKYIYIAEEKGRIHFHMLVNREIDITTKLMKRLWPYGYSKVELYRGGAEDAIQISSYFMKERKHEPIEEEAERIFKRRFVGSKNLEQPKEVVKEVKATEWKGQIKVPKGYYLDKDSIYEGVNNAGYPFRFYRLLRLKEFDEGSVRRR